MGSFILYQNYLKRFPNAATVQDNFFRRRSLLGRVTSVGDGDGFHLYHTPGGKLAGWGWLRKIPDARADLKGNTVRDGCSEFCPMTDAPQISIRLAGVDAPEGPHFGRPGQPYAAEALTFLSDYIRHRSVRAQIYKRDQYNRIVATVHVRRFLFKKDVGLELLKQGLATTYEAKSGIEWGGKKEIYEAAQAKAKAKKVGMWSAKSSDFESPRAYKTKLYEAEKASDAEAVQEKKSWWRRWLS